LDGTSYIHLAAVSDKPKIVEELLKRGADPNIRILLRGVLSDRYVTALELAQVVQSHKVQEILLHYGAEHLEVLPPEERLFHAVYHNELENVRNLIKSGTPLEPQDNKSVSALFQAALMGYIQMASLLLENGAKVNFGNETALHAACKTGNTLMTDLLLKKGADPYQKCTLDGKTAADHGVHFPGISKLLKDYDKKMEKKKATEKILNENEETESNEEKADRKELKQEYKEQDQQKKEENKEKKEKKEKKEDDKERKEGNKEKKEKKDKKENTNQEKKVEKGKENQGKKEENMEERLKEIEVRHDKETNSKDEL